jgi:hypothetical protein
MRAFVARLAAMCVVLSTVAMSGCGGGTGDVSGVVKFKGQPLEGGQISFKGGKGKLVGFDINPDGTFLATGVPTGKVKVAVSSLDGEKMVEHFRKASAAGRGESKAPPPKGDPSKMYTKLPPKYGDPDASDITIDVKAGKNDNVTIDLKDIPNAQ